MSLDADNEDAWYMFMAIRRTAAAVGALEAGTDCVAAMAAATASAEVLFKPDSGPLELFLNAALQAEKERRSERFGGGGLAGEGCARTMPFDPHRKRRLRGLANANAGASAASAAAAAAAADAAARAAAPSAGRGKKHMLCAATEVAVAAATAAAMAAAFAPRRGGPAAAGAASDSLGVPGGAGASGLAIDMPARPAPSEAALASPLEALPTPRRSANVRLGVSRIQGVGVFATRSLSSNAPVIEYVGDIVRNVVADRREVEYRTRRDQDYQFRLDRDHVIDATRVAGPARFINHSCEPNCYARIYDADEAWGGGALAEARSSAAAYAAVDQDPRRKHIVVYALRDIASGEELTYDYKFPVDDEEKVPCFCGAPSCKGYINRL